MAKLKTIKCPQCGSPDYIELSEDKYKCKSCGASYYFDKEKAELNINHNYNGLIDFVKESKKIIFGVIAALLFFFILVFIIPFIFSSHKSQTPHYGTYSVKESDANKEDEYDESTEAIIGTFYKGEPVVLDFCKRDYRNINPWKSSFVMKIIGKDKNVIEEKTLVDKTDQDDKQIKMFDELRIQAFTDQSIWLIANNKFIYKLNAETFQIEPMNDKFVHGMTELASGLSKVEFGYQVDGFKVINNEAVEYYLFPLIDKIFTRDGFYRARSGQNGLTGKEQPDTGYFFYDGAKTTDDAIHDNPKKKLYIYSYLNYKHGPRQDFCPGWASMGQYIAWNRKTYKVQSMKELTPDRYYFYASVVFESPELCVITYKVDISDESPQIMQCIDNTGKVLWTLPDTEMKGSYNCTAHQGNIFIFSDYRKVLAVDNTGKIILKYGN